MRLPSVLEGGKWFCGFNPDDPYGAHAVDNFFFSFDGFVTYQQLIDRGMTFAGTEANDVLVGTAARDIFTGAVGDDQLQGGRGNDIYNFNRGDDVDTIEDVVRPGEGNSIQFGAGITSADVTFERVGNVLDIKVLDGTAGTLHLTNFDPSGLNGTLVVGTLGFTDGSTLNLADLFPTTINHAPTLATPLADQIVPEDALFGITVPANTFADEDTGDVLTYSASLADGTALPTWLGFDATTQTFSGTPDDAQVGNLDLRVAATDASNLTV